MHLLLPLPLCRFCFSKHRKNNWFGTSVISWVFFLDKDLKLTIAGVGLVPLVVSFAELKEVFLAKKESPASVLNFAFGSTVACITFHSLSPIAFSLFPTFQRKYTWLNYFMLVLLNELSID